MKWSTTAELHTKPKTRPLFNIFFNSVFSAKEPVRIKDIKVENPTLTYFSISKANIKSILLELDITKTRGPNDIPPILNQRTSEQMSSKLHKVFKNIKRLKRLPKKWKVDAVSPIYKKGNRKLMNNYRGISLLNIDIKCFEKCMYEPLYTHFVQFMSDHQHGFVRKSSTLSNMIKFLQRVHHSLECNKEDNVIAFYSDFSKAFDRVPHRLLLEKCASFGVGGCFLEILHDYLSGREQFVRMKSCSSATLEVTSGAPQGSLLGPLIFCIFINNLPDLLKFSEPFIFADNLNLLLTGKADWQIQEDLNSIQHWVKTNKMDLAIGKCAELKIHHHSGDLMLGTSQLHGADSIKVLGIFVTKDMTWSLHKSERFKKANKALYLLRRNVSPKVNVSVKLGLYKSILLPILLYGMNCVRLSRGSTRDLESFQKRALNWVCYESNRSYLQQIRLLNVLPLPLFMQCNDILLMSKLLVEGKHNINIPTCNPEYGRSTLFFKLNKCKKEKTLPENLSTGHAESKTE